MTSCEFGSDPLSVAKTYLICSSLQISRAKDSACHGRVEKHKPYANPQLQQEDLRAACTTEMSHNDSIKTNMPPSSGEETMLEPKKPSSNNYTSVALLHNLCCKVGGTKENTIKKSP